MRALFPIVIFLVASVGCAIPANDQSVYDLPTHKYEGNGGSSGAPGDPGTSQMDAATCAVQGNASVTGAIGGASFAPKDAIELFDSTKARFTFLITDFANACAIGGAIHAGSNIVSIEYTGNALRSADYDVTKTPELVVKYTTYDAGCKATTTATAASGTVTFDKLDECGGVGSFDLVFGGEHVTSSFTASVCAVPSQVASCH